MTLFLGPQHVSCWTFWESEAARHEWAKITSWEKKEIGARTKVQQKQTAIQENAN